MRSSIAAIASNTLSRGARCLRTAAILAVLLCVSAPASAAFVDNGDGTISDSVSGLTWDHAPFTSCGGTGAAQRNWQSALTAASTASGCNYRGHNDWRLPNIKELESLVDITRSATAPAVFANGLIGAPSPTTYFWSSTTYPAAQAGVISAFVIFTYDGSFTPLQISNNAYALLVRGGQSFDTLHPPPIVSATSVAPIGYTNATFNATSNAAGAGFVIAVPTGSAAPATAQVISIAKAGGAGSYTSGTGTVSVIASGFDFLSAGAATAFPLSGFVPATSYDVYFIANDTFGNSSALAGPFTFTTLSNATTTTISAINPNPLTFAPGATTMISVSVVRSTDLVAPNSGTVIVQNTTDGSSCAVALAAASTCAIMVSGAGTKSLSAAFFSTDTNNFANSATSGSATLTVNQAPQTIVFGAAPGIAVGGSGTVSASGGASGNSVVFSTTSAACSVAANGTVSGLGVGSCVVIANQAGNTDYSPAVAATQTLTIGQASSALGLTSSLASSVFGHAVTFSAVVISANAAAAGTITFTADGSPVPLCPVQPLIGGSASCATTALIAGTHTIAAVYSGDINTTGSSAPVLQQSVAKAQTTTTLTAPAPIVFGQSVDVTATVAVKAPGAGTPTGSITISDGGASPGDSCTIALPADHCTLTPGAPANATLTATYVPDSGSSANIGGSSATAALTVNPATSSVVLGSSANPAVFGQSVTLTAVVTTSNPNAGGTVSFSEGGTALTGCGAIAMASGGIAVCQTSNLSTGPHTLVATYSGDAVTPASSNAASPLSQAVIKAATVVTLTPPGATALGNSVSVSATAAVVAPGAGTLTGTITISDGGSAPHDTCTIVLPATQCSLTPSSVGTLTLNASYAPDTAAAANFSGSSASGSLSVSQAGSTISLASSNEPAVFGQAITLTAKVSALGPPPTGSVAFSEADGTPIAGCAAVTLSAGIANCQTSALSVGTHALVATYSGDANTVGASNANAPLTQTVDQAATAVTLTAPAPITLGNSVLVSAAVAVVVPGAGTLSGTIAVSDGGSGAGDTCTIVLPATACSLTPSSAGAKTLTATYTPDSAASANFTGSSTSGSLTVAAAPSGMSLASSVNPSAFGENVVFTATVTPANGGVSPGGTVTFLDGAAPLCPPTALLPGSAAASVTCAAPALAVGNHPISASYSGDANNQPTTATLAGGQTVHAAATTTTISPLAPITLGAGVAVQVTVAAQAPGAGTPDGTVAISDGSVTCTAALSNGSGSCTLTPKAPAGAHSISAVYTATANFATSTATASLTVNAATAGTMLTSSANPSVFGQSVTLSATVTPVTGGAMPTGSVTFRDGTTVLCSQVALVAGSGNAAATCAANGLATGAHSITASYGGDANNLASQSPATTQTVNKAATTLTLSTPAAITLGQSANVTISLGVVAPGAGTPSGEVVIDDGAGATCTITLPATGCSLTPVAPAGVHSISAIYTATANFAASTATASLTVNAATAGTTLTSSVNPSVFGQSIMLSATVAPATGGAMPTGSVTFRDGATVLCSQVALVAGSGNAAATCAANGLAAGAHSITASYGGDANNLASQSPATTQTVNKAATTLTLSAPAAITLGQSANVTISLGVVVPGAGTPSGEVTIDDGVGARCTMTLPATGCSLTPVASGNLHLSATYAGDADFAASSATATLGVGTLHSTVTLASSANPATLGGAVTFTVTVAAQSASVATAAALAAPNSPMDRSVVPASSGSDAAANAAPTGSVMLSDNGSTLATLTLDATGAASYTTSALGVGSHTIVAAYSGDARTAAASATLTQTVGAAPTAVVPAPAVSGWMLVLLALVLLAAAWRRATATIR